MTILVPILLSLTVCSLSHSSQALRESKEIAQRRQYSYVNSVIHQDPSHPDQAAESTVKVSFNPNKDQQISQYNYAVPTQRIKTIQHYSQGFNTYNRDDYDASQTQFQANYNQNQNKYNPASQLFNVGYSVSFTNPEIVKQPNPTKYTRTTNLDNGEIITGIKKQNEEVQSPANFNFSPQDFVTTALIDSKKGKISGIKPKINQNPQTYSNPKILINQANLSPTTHKYLKALDHVKTPVQNQQELQQKYSWRSLSPSVEIIKSTEVPVINKLPKLEQNYHFDHAKALGKSQDFDYSNAIDGEAIQQNQFFINQPTLPPITRQLPIPSNHHQTPQINTNNHNQGALKYPMDTTLLNEPVRIDTKLIQEALRNEFTAATQKLLTPIQNVQPEPTVPLNNAHPRGLSTQNYAPGYHTIKLDHEQTQPFQVVYNQEDEPKNVHDYQQDYQQNQNKYQYKIYGKPQPLEHIQRQPRYSVDYNLDTNLRPPPIITNRYQRKIILG